MTGGPAYSYPGAAPSVNGAAQVAGPLLVPRAGQTAQNSSPLRANSGLAASLAAPGSVDFPSTSTVSPSPAEGPSPATSFTGLPPQGVQPASVRAYRMETPSWSPPAPVSPATSAAVPPGAQVALGSPAAVPRPPMIQGSVSSAPAISLKGPVGAGRPPEVKPTGATKLPTADEKEVQALKEELLSLRSELDSLRSMLEEGLQQRDDAEKSKGLLNRSVEQLNRRREAAETQLREAQAEAAWLRNELARCQRKAREAEVERASSPPRDGSGGTHASREATHDPKRGRSGSAASSGPLPTPGPGAGSAVNGHQRRHSPGHSASAPAARPPSPTRGPAGRPPPRLSNGMDEIDELWRAALQRFPQYPHWCLVKEKRGLYRLGSPSGRKLLCRVSHGGLQVRVGGGWMGAIPFLEKYGPLTMGPAPTIDGRIVGHHDYLSSMVDTPPSMERLLVPTKCWAQKIGISKSPDLREQRAMALSDDLDYEDEALPSALPPPYLNPPQPASAGHRSLASLAQEIQENGGSRGDDHVGGSGLSQGLQSWGLSKLRHQPSAEENGALPSLEVEQQGSAHDVHEALHPLPWPGAAIQGVSQEEHENGYAEVSPA